MLFIHFQHITLRLNWYVLLFFPPINSILRQTFYYFASLERHIPDISIFSFSFLFRCCNVKAERWMYWAWAWTWDLDWMVICLLRHWNICRNQYFKHVLARDQRSYENWTYLILFPFSLCSSMDGCSYTSSRLSAICCEWNLIDISVKKTKSTRFDLDECNKNRTSFLKRDECSEHSNTQLVNLRKWRKTKMKGQLIGLIRYGIRYDNNEIENKV